MDKRKWFSDNVKKMRDNNLFVGDIMDEEVVNKAIRLYDKELKDVDFGHYIAIFKTVKDHVYSLDDMYMLFGLTDYTDFPKPEEEICKDRSPKKYTILSQIGEGVSGTVYKARFKGSEKIFAVKVMELGKADGRRDTVNHIKNELRALKTLSEKCPKRVSTLYDWHCEKNKIILKMEYIPGKVLSEVKIKSIKQLQHIFMGLAKAVKCLQDNNIVHMDLHTNNIMADSKNNVKLIDFGMACFNSLSCGVFKAYIADWRSYKDIRPPELVEDTSQKEIRLFKKIDLWMLGFTFEDLIKSNKSDDIVGIYEGLIGRLKSKDPEKRPDIDSVISELELLKKYRVKLNKLAMKVNLFEWEVYDCIVYTSEIHQISFEETIELVLK